MMPEAGSIARQARNTLRLGALLAAALLGTQCAAPISVSKARVSAPAGTAVTSGNHEAWLDAARVAGDKVARGDTTALAAYNFAVARLIEQLEQSGADPWSAPMVLAGTGGIRRLRGIAPSGCAPLEDKLVPADTLEFHGKFAKNRATVAGIGAPLVEISSFSGIGHREIRAHQPVRALTALVRFTRDEAILELVDPYQHETVTFAGRQRQVAADYGAVMMLVLSKARIDKLGLARLLRPSRYNDTVHLNFVQPYDPRRIPVLFVHGLQDTPASFAPLYFRLLEDPVIRKNYQFWVFSYPSGYPYPYSGSLLRRQLDRVQREFPDHRKLVIVGHSMGGIISRLMVTDAGDTLWRKAFGRPPEKTPMVGHSRQILVDSLVFRQRPEIDRAVFIAAPHRGSVLASNWVGRIGSRLVRLPSFVADLKDSVLSVATADVAGLAMTGVPNSIDTLSPDNRFVRAINQIPIAPGIPYHTIAGDRGKGNTPNSSDGVVPYWSSHLDGAVSEKIVPSDHMAHQNSQGIEEVHRILLLHLKGR